MKKILLSVIVLLMSITFFGCKNGAELKVGQQDNKEQQQIDEAEEQNIVNIVEGFGSKLKEVSLQATKEIVEKSMKDSYGSFVSPTLLEKWINDPLNAPGRLTSSPWPDRIEILSTEKLSEDTYEVKGKIIEITSVEEVSGGIAAQRPITLVIKKINNKWLIDEVTLGDYEKNNSIVYQNTQYGFDFSLPNTWKDYSIVTSEWEGVSLKEQESGKVIEKGPIIYIRHPQWTSENPRQDIPIMVFTLNQWDLVQNDEFHIGAAPMNPSELGRNSKYVFALPARYNYAFLTGYEEIEDILESNPLKPIENN